MFNDISFSGSTVNMKANANELESASCTNAINSLKSIGRATCEREILDEDSGKGTYLITIEEFRLTHMRITSLLTQATHLCRPFGVI